VSDQVVGNLAEVLGCQDGVELVADTRLGLSLNVSEELALEALAYRLEDLLAGTAAQAIGPRFGSKP